MKRKVSFVTNSSSCAFIIIAKKVEIDEIDFEKDNISSIDSNEEPFAIADIETAEKYKENLWLVYYESDIKEDETLQFSNLNIPQDENENVKIITGTRQC